MKYFEKLAKEDSAIPELIGGGATGAVAALHVTGEKVKKRTAENLKGAYKARRVSTKIPGAAKANKLTRTGLRVGGKIGAGLAIGGAAAVGAGITHLLD